MGSFAILLPVLGAVKFLKAMCEACNRDNHWPPHLSLLPASIVSTRTQVAVRQALRWAQKADGRWLTRDACACHCHTCFCFPVTLRPTMRNFEISGPVFVSPFLTQKLHVTTFKGICLPQFIFLMISSDQSWKHDNFHGVCHASSVEALGL